MMGKLRAITTSTFLMLVRNKQSLFFTFFLPLALMLVIGFITQSDATTLRVGVVYDRAQPTAQQIVDGLQQVDALEISTGSLEEEKAAIEENNRDLVVDIPVTLTLVPAAPPTTITFYENIAKPAESNIAELIITQTLQQIQLYAAQQSPAFTITREQVSARQLRYIDFLVPGIIAMTIMQLGIFGTAFAIVDAKQKGVLKRVMATPIAPWQYIIGNMLARLAISFIQSAILVAVAVLVFDVRFQHWGWLVLLVVLGNAVFLSLGLFVSGVAKTTESVPVLGNLIVFPMLLLGGIFFQTGSLPEWLKLIVDKLPVALLADLMRNTVTLDHSLADVWRPLVYLVIWAAVTLFLANTFFRLQEKE